MAFGDPVLQDLLERMEPLRKVLAFVNAPDPWVVLTWLDADPDAVRAKAMLLAGPDGGSAHAQLTAATTRLQSRVSAVDSAWKGAASDEFVRYMGAVKTYSTDVLSRLQKQAQAGMALAAAVQQLKDDSVAYIGSQLESIAVAIGQVGAALAAGAGIGAVVGGVGAAPGAVVGLIVGVVVAIIDYVRRGLQRVAAMDKLFNAFDSAVPNAVGDLNATPFAETETGFDDRTDVSRDNWQPVTS